MSVPAIRLRTTGNRSIRLRSVSSIKGDKGDTGDNASIAVGTTATGLPGSDASVANSGSLGAAVLDFTIPRGDQGERGIQGEKGDRGDVGPAGATGINGAPTTGHVAKFFDSTNITDGGALPSGAIVGTTDSQTLTNKTFTSPAINSPTGIVKGDVGLGNVDNTSDATKNAANVTLTNKTIDKANNTLVGIAASGANADITSLTGVIDGSDAASGKIGEYISAQSAGGDVSLTTTTPANIVSISLTAGDWDVEGWAQTVPAGTTTTQFINFSISTASATLSGSGYRFTLSFPAGGDVQLPLPTTRVSISSTTTVYLVGQVNFGVSTMKGRGFIRARRVR